MLEIKVTFKRLKDGALINRNCIKLNQNFYVIQILYSPVVEQRKWCTFLHKMAFDSLQNVKYCQTYANLSAIVGYKLVVLVLF